MAVLDSLGEFADATALSTAGTGLALVGNVINLGAPPTGSVFRDIGNGRPVYLVVTIDTAVTSGGAANVSVSLVSDAQAAIATDGSATVHATSASIAKATLVAGYVLFIIALPWEGPPYEQFLGILQNVATTALTAGKINAYLTLDPPAWKAYTDGV